MSKDRRTRYRRARRRGNQRSIEVRVGAPANLTVQRDLLEEGRLEEETRMMVSIVAITRKDAEVDWAKAFVAEIAKEAEKYLALKLKTVVGVGKPFKTRALVVPVVDGKESWPMPDEMLAFRTKAVENELAEAADVGAAKETGLGLESLGSVLIQSVVLHFACAVLDVFPKVRPALVETVVKIGRADERLRRGVPGGSEGDLCIDAADAVGADNAAIVTASRVGHGSKLAVGIDKADGGLLANIAIHAKHTEVGFGSRERVTRSNRLARGLIVRKEGADRPRTLLASETQAVIGVGDAASKDKIYGSGEVACIFEKEGTLFRKENLETLVDGDLRLVGFNLSKIRIQGGVEDKGILEYDFRIEAGTGVEALSKKWGTPPGRSSRPRKERSEP